MSALRLMSVVQPITRELQKQSFAEELLRECLFAEAMAVNRQIRET